MYPIIEIKTISGASTMKSPYRLVSFLAVVGLLSASLVFAHHSPFLFFDPTSSIEIEGTIQRIHWRNPHPEFVLAVTDESGEVANWILEAHSVSILRRMDIGKDKFAVGDRVKVAGWPSKRGGNELFITNMLLPQGIEVAMDPGSQPKWAATAEGDKSVWLVTEDSLVVGEDTDSIFHVWSTSLATGDGSFLFENFDFPLTAEAAVARAEYDMYSNPILGTCTFKGMPTIMEQPYPMELIDHGDKITMHMEEGDTVRVFDMTPSASAADKGLRPLGHSVGEWQDDVLVITTVGSDWPYVDMTGIPNSDDAVYVERFTAAENGTTLDYTLTITDPGTFTSPPTFTKTYLWLAGAEVRPYDCEAREIED